MAKTTKKSTRSKSSVKWLLLMGLALIILAYGVSWALSRYSNPDSSSSAAVKKKPASYVNLNPPTADEKKAADDAKAAIAQTQSQTTPTSASGKKSVMPTIVHADGTGAAGDAWQLRSFR